MKGREIKGSPMKWVQGTNKWVCTACGTEYWVGQGGGGLFDWCPKCGKPDQAIDPPLLKNIEKDIVGEVKL